MGSTAAIAGRVRRAVSHLAAGGMILVVDAAERENEGDLVAAASLVTEEQVAFMVAHTTGILCAPMSERRAAELRLPPMVPDSENTDTHCTAFTVTVDHVSAGTGVSAANRRRTIRALADQGTGAHELRRPGHVFPLRAREGGVLVRAGHTEASVDLLRLAGLQEVAVIGEMVAADGSMARGDQLDRFAAEHAIPLLAIADLVSYRYANEQLVTAAAEADMPTEFGSFRATAYRSEVDGSEHLAMVLGDVAAAGRREEGVLVRVHSECLTGDILGSLRCDCGTQLEQSLQAIAAEGCGVLVYLRGHEGRGIGLCRKIQAYALQDDGLDTVDANTALGLPVDARTYGTAAHILRDLGVRRIRLITNNPEKHRGLDGYGVDVVRRVALPSIQSAHNVRYLRTKRDRLGHELTVVDAAG
ncbi:bifunctional 3,4-dihydroxy-2-butanone-4-phosphate synthase/GTP cyclohydrolase II [Amycolatopsis sp.]|jgi:3,4-dihydroxy 2-butanone 4-phosphate synthase/GTP cyclohydrolase II|uniref:bifunctional 3,4-dihydroxy-2-butanone-4-phosphate synthase/GTP cyclohydrolase II n=1 Tax=Amycolatopsis sp. TaxID=37632 RepID=UPI002E0AFE76|nr:bifunctional 3,4-dihydroxy-2-butanone-4-phosphate synthase/GTP cyclohydrolase II [Amycolatopsis sp.]